MSDAMNRIVTKESLLATENERNEMSNMDATALYNRKRSSSNAFGLSIEVPVVRVKRNRRRRKLKRKGILNLVTGAGLDLRIHDRTKGDDAWFCPSKCGVCIRRSDAARIERHSRLCLKLRNMQDVERVELANECPNSREEYGTPRRSAVRVSELLDLIHAEQKEVSSNDLLSQEVKSEAAVEMIRAMRELRDIRLRYETKEDVKGVAPISHQNGLSALGADTTCTKVTQGTEAAKEALPEPETESDPLNNAQQ